MGRLKGSINKTSSERPIASTLSPSERIQFLANLIIDRMIEDQNNGAALLNKIKDTYDGASTQN